MANYFYYEDFCGTRHAPERKSVPRQTICSDQIPFQVYLTKLMILLVYQLYARWNYLTNCTGYKKNCKSLEQITWLLNYSMTPPYKYVEHQLRNSPNRYISGTVIFFLVAVGFLYQILIGTSKIFIFFILQENSWHGSV